MNDKVAAIGLGVLLLAGFAISGTLEAHNEKQDRRQVTQTIEEDDPRWDCATMGNKVCGWKDPLLKQGWEPVSQELADALAEGEEAGSTRDWEDCLVRYGDTTWIRCEDGLTFSS